MFGVLRRVKPIFAISKAIHFRRNFLTCPPPTNSKVMKVAILGAAGRTGKCLALLLKRSVLIDEVALYDTVPLENFTVELSHIDASCKVYGYSGISRIHEALLNAKVVVIAAGEPDKLSQEGDVLKTNANILAELIPHVIEHSPRAMLAIVTSPVNSLIPLVAEFYKNSGLTDLGNIFGVTTLDCVRANTFAAEVLHLPPEAVVVPVIGGSCANTCVPLFSRVKPSCNLTSEEIGKLTMSVKQAHQELIKCYDGKGSPSVGMAFATARFCISLCKGLRGLPGVVECAYVRSCVVPDVTYFATPLVLGPCGIQRNLGVPALTDYECKMLNNAIPLLQSDIKAGEMDANGDRTYQKKV